MICNINIEKLKAFKYEPYSRNDINIGDYVYLQFDKDHLIFVEVKDIERLSKDIKLISYEYNGFYYYSSFVDVLMFIKGSEFNDL